MSGTCPKCDDEYATKLTVNDTTQAELMADLHDIDEYCLETVTGTYRTGSKAMYVHEHGD